MGGHHLKRLLAFAFPLIFLAVPAPAQASAHAQGGSVSRIVTTPRQETTKPPLTLIFTKLPKYVKSASTLTVQVELKNPTSATYTGVNGRMYFSPASFPSRGSLDEYARGNGPDPQSGDFHLTKSAVLIGPHASVVLGTISVRVKTMALPPGFGVYPLLVTATDALGRTLANQRTFLVNVDNDQRTQPKTKIAWVWPIIDRPHRTNDTTFVDDRLTTALAAGGRLGSLVTTGQSAAKTPLSWLVDPALIDDAEAMVQNGGYQVQGKSRPASPVARQWLSGLHQATMAATVPSFLTPYADPDVMALTRANRADDIKSATDDGLRATHQHANVLNPPAPMALAVPPAGVADGDTLSRLVSNGADTILLSSQSLVPSNQALTYTPNPRKSIRVAGRAVNAIAYDATLTQLLGSGSHTLGQSRIAEQRFLAETAMVADELPTVTRAVVAVPPRRWDPAPDFAKAVLADSSGVPWLRAVPLAAVEALPSTARSITTPKGAASAGLPSSYLKLVGQLSDRVSRFSSILVHQPNGFQLGIPRLESSAWQTDTQAGDALRKQLSAQLAGDAVKVKVLDKQVSLAGRTGQIPLTITNGLSQGTVTVQLRAIAKNPKQLVIGHFQGERKISAGKSVQIGIPVKSQANGVAVVSLELVGPDGEMFTDPTIMRVQTTAYGQTALIIIGASLGVLFLTVGVRIMRRRRNGDGREGTGA